MLYREGVHTAPPECASVKRMPSLANLSIAGVDVLAKGLLEETSPNPMSSARIITTLGFSPESFGFSPATEEPAFTDNIASPVATFLTEYIFPISFVYFVWLTPTLDP